MLTPPSILREDPELLSAVVLTDSMYLSLHSLASEIESSLQAETRDEIFENMVYASRLAEILLSIRELEARCGLEEDLIMEVLREPHPTLINFLQSLNEDNVRELLIRGNDLFFLLIERVKKLEGELTDIGKLLSSDNQRIRDVIFILYDLTQKHNVELETIFILLEKIGLEEEVQRLRLIPVEHINQIVSSHFQELPRKTIWDT